jgi:hypothetical protein
MLDAFKFFGISRCNYKPNNRLLIKTYVKDHFKTEEIIIIQFNSIRVYLRANLV